MTDLTQEQKTALVEIRKIHREHQSYRQLEAQLNGVLVQINMLEFEVNLLRTDSRIEDYKLVEWDQCFDKASLEKFNALDQLVAEKRSKT